MTFQNLLHQIQCLCPSVQLGISIHLMNEREIIQDSELFCHRTLLFGSPKRILIVLHIVIDSAQLGVAIPEQHRIHLTMRSTICRPA